MGEGIACLVVVVWPAGQLCRGGEIVVVVKSAGLVCRVGVGSASLVVVSSSPKLEARLKLKVVSGLSRLVDPGIRGTDTTTGAMPHKRGTGVVAVVGPRLSGPMSTPTGDRLEDAKEVLEDADAISQPVVVVVVRGAVVVVV